MSDKHSRWRHTLKLKRVARIVRSLPEKPDRTQILAACIASAGIDPALATERLELASVAYGVDLGQLRALADKAGAA